MSELFTAGFRELETIPVDERAVYEQRASDLRLAVAATLHQCGALIAGSGTAYYSFNPGQEAIQTAGNIDFCIVQKREPGCLMPNIQIIYNETTGESADEKNLGVITKEFWLPATPGLTLDAVLHHSFINIPKAGADRALHPYANSPSVFASGECGPKYIQANTTKGEIDIFTASTGPLGRDWVIDLDVQKQAVFLNPPDDLDSQTAALCFAESIVDMAQRQPPSIIWSSS